MRQKSVHAQRGNRQPFERTVKPEIGDVQQHLWLDRVEQGAMELEMRQQAFIACQQGRGTFTPPHVPARALHHSTKTLE